MDFSLGDRAEAFRSEVRTFLDGHLTADVIERMHATGTFNAKDFNAGLAEAGLLAMVLVVLSGALTWLLVVRRADHLD